MQGASAIESKVLWSCSILYSILLVCVCPLGENDIEQIRRRFLWKGKYLQGAKVSWDPVCLPTNEGGLGMKREYMNGTRLLLPNTFGICCLRIPKTFGTSGFHQLFSKDRASWVWKHERLPSDKRDWRPFALRWKKARSEEPRSLYLP